MATNLLFDIYHVGLKAHQISLELVKSTYKKKKVSQRWKKEYLKDTITMKLTLFSLSSKDKIRPHGVAVGSAVASHLQS